MHAVPAALYTTRQGRRQGIGRGRTGVRGAYGVHASRIEGTHLGWLPALTVGVAMVLAAPIWPWSRGWGWVPAAMVGVVLLTILLFTLSVVPA